MVSTAPGFTVIVAFANPPSAFNAIITRLCVAHDPAGIVIFFTSDRIDLLYVYSAIFTPSTSTLTATIGFDDDTSYRTFVCDDTCAPSVGFLIVTLIVSSGTSV